MDLAQPCAHTLCIGLGSLERGMGVVVVEKGSHPPLSHLVVFFGGDVVQVDELHPRLFHHLTIPFPISVVAALNMSVAPNMAWCE